MTFAVTPQSFIVQALPVPKGPLIYSRPKAAPEDAGDIWTWVAIDAETKLVPSWRIGMVAGESKTRRGSCYNQTDPLPIPYLG